MTVIDLHIGPDAATTERVQRVLDAARGKLANQAVLFARSLGARNHTRLAMAFSDPESPDSLRVARGFAGPMDQAALAESCQARLRAEIAKHAPRRVILSAHQLGSVLHRPTELARLRDLLAPLCTEIRVHAHLDDPARLLARFYAAQVLDGRIRPLSMELAMLAQPDFRAAALASMPPVNLPRGIFADVQAAPHWLDFAALQSSWEDAFGRGALRFHTLDRTVLYGAGAGQAIADALGLDVDPGGAAPESLPEEPSAAWLSRCRRMNDTLLRYVACEGVALPRSLWRKLLGEIKQPGPPIAPGSLHAVSARFAGDLDALAAAHPAVDPAALAPDPAQDPWAEADPLFGFRPTQYLMAFEWRIKQASKKARAEAALNAATRPSGKDGAAPVDALLSPTARATMPALAKQNFVRLRRSPYAPHNRLGMVDEEALAAPFVAARSAPETRRIIVACMKNEAPYILEWVAYHRAVGFDDFLIYTNDCDDGTDAILDRLADLGVLHHRDNSDWSGQSPQQFALNRAMKEPVVRRADWIAHIDVDEFVNIRCGNGTLDDLFARVPGATNIAMTWRLFGHNGVRHLSDRLVIEQFDMAAPRYCPKPHTAWGFKTLFRNIGAYGKIACHRPNRLDAQVADKVRWVNGSGQDMTAEAIRNGWRNSRKSIGYDLVQLNHYALRSAESFLIKRQRGRALHVDRSIGLNYWIRMDWSNVRDITIQRNLPRVRAEYERLLQDDTLRALHEDGQTWHREKAFELHGKPEFEELYQQALALDLTETERVAWALALDMES